MVSSLRSNVHPRIGTMCFVYLLPRVLHIIISLLWLQEQIIQLPWMLLSCSVGYTALVYNVSRTNRESYLLSRNFGDIFDTQLTLEVETTTRKNEAISMKWKSVSDTFMQHDWYIKHSEILCLIPLVLSTCTLTYTHSHTSWYKWAINSYGKDESLEIKMSSVLTEMSSGCCTCFKVTRLSTGCPIKFGFQINNN